MDAPLGCDVRTADTPSTKLANPPVTHVMPGITPNPTGSGFPVSKRVTKDHDGVPRALATYPSQSLQFMGHVSDVKPLQRSTKTGSKFPTEARVKLSVVVVGAGLGGLALSIALARRGHVVRVLEQAKQLGEVSKTVRNADLC